jgi:hypothetical protein
MAGDMIATCLEVVVDVIGVSLFDRSSGWRAWFASSSGLAESMMDDWAAFGWTRPHVLAHDIISAATSLFRWR